MRTRILTALALAALVIGLPAPAPAQSGDPGTEYHGAPKPAKKPEKKPERPRRPAASSRVALTWRLVARDERGILRDVDPSAPLALGESARLVVHPSQDGFLYVLHQEEGKKPEILFPDNRLNDGQNFVAADADYNIPAYCPEGAGASDCWQRITRAAGRGYLIVVLTAERRTDLVNELVRRGPVQFDQARRRIVDATGARIVNADTEVDRDARVASGAPAPVKVADASPSDRQVVEVVPLTVVEPAKQLALQWRLVKREKNGSTHDVNALNALATGDDVRLLCRADQDGYLYVFQQDEGKKPVLLFPDSRVNDGRNFVSRDQEYSIPPYCPEEKSGGSSCWDKITAVAGHKSLVVLFSTEKDGGDVVKRFTAGAVSVDAATGRIVDAGGQALARIDTRAARVEPVAAKGTGFPVRVVNADEGDTHLVDVVSLNVVDPVQPMAIQWSLVRRDRAGKVEDVDPATMFLRNDDVRFVCKAKHDGYLYVLYQEAGAKPTVVFPDSRINNGQNFVAANQEYNVPAYCAEGRGAVNCWQQLTRRSGRNVLIVVFGPDKNSDLVDKILKGGPISVDEVASGQVVDTTSTFVLGLVSPRESTKPSAPGPYVVQSAGSDPANTEPLVDAIVINVDKRAR